MRYLANNEKLIQTLADSYPMRKAARFVAGILIRTKLYKERTLEELRKANPQGLTEADKSEVSQNFTQFMKNRIEKLKKMLEDDKYKR
ncbi:hypothetical protein JTE90_028754 [Oedothorax gibbosus]|uniref:Uncharacterized protein n=1 Tax=Oedothorax gibbosus TaxID=931172 RepID=A0AAV6VYE8_9ARAC|nr:hypothetical protein JTE90_028754 [Oedothorax gibbosus]